ncbi:dihydrolipoamide acetyltransferase family protein [Dokdonella sp.]|uniref:dihydrolipoamide acetyltransferase family protein n=1 Tax=Dokdonella sp. TaxID=2291710 RepID=UPI003C5FD928
MSETKTFHLPDLGEGLPDATIVEWFVKPGDVAHLDEPLVSMETAKAVVEVPSPFSGKVAKQYGNAGDVIETGAALIDIELDASLPQRADAEETGHHHGPPKTAKAKEAEQTSASESKSEKSGSAERADSGTVVGAMEAGDHVHTERTSTAGGVKAVPAVRALAKKLGVDLALVNASGAEGVITLKDVKSAAEAGTAKQGTRPAAARAASGPAQSATPAPAPAPAARRAESERTALSATGQPMRTTPPTQSVSGQPEQLKGVRRNMARVMADAHAKVVPTTLCDDADIHAWTPGNDITVRLIRSMVRACQAVPALNAWFDGDKLTRTLHPHVDIGIAVDTDDGLFVPALRNADVLDANGIRQAINRLRDQVVNRSIPAEELKGYTISLSNFGVFAGRYATPIVVPPTVAIVAAGKGRHQMTPVMGGFESHKIVPISVTFDHRAATGGEAARFLKALLDDLARPN